MKSQTEAPRTVSVDVPARIQLMQNAKLDSISLAQMIDPLTQSEVARIEERVASIERTLSKFSTIAEEFLSYKKATELLASELNVVHKMPIFRRAGKKEAADVILITASVFGISPEQIMSRARPDYIAIPRMVCMFVMRTSLAMTLQQIGNVFGKDHGTAIHAIKTIEKMMTKGWARERERCGIPSDTFVSKVDTIRAQFPSEYEKKDGKK